MEETKTNWVSVQDDLPREPGRYLICLEDGDKVYIASHDRRTGWSNLEKSMMAGPPDGWCPYVTFWAHMPEGKKAE